MKIKKTIIFATPHKKILSLLPQKIKNYHIYTPPWSAESPEFFMNKKIRFFPHPFENKKKHEKAFYIIIKKYNYLLNDLSKFLNKTHNVEYSKNYWELIVGKWLLDFLVVTYEKYLIIEKIKNSKNIIYYQIKYKTYLPQNSRESLLKTFITHSWNQNIFSYFIKKMKPKIKFQLVLSNLAKESSQTNSKKLKNNFLKIIIKFFFFLSMQFKKKNEIFILNSYLGVYHELLFQLKINGLIKLNQRFDYVSISKKNNKIRSFYKTYTKEDTFIKLVKPILIDNLPKSYLEDYKQIINFIDKIPWPKKPKKIFTAVNNFYDDVFKIWCAEKKRKYRAKLIFSQHGGGFQQAKFSHQRNYLLNTCDQILVWGKNTIKNKKIKSFLNIKSSPRLFTKTQNRDLSYLSILLIQDMPKLYTSSIESCFLHFSEYKNFVLSQSIFIKKLNNEKRNKILVRLGSISENSSASNNLLNYEKKIWEDAVPKIKTENRDDNIKKSINKSYIVIITQICSTTLLECITSNIPFLIYFDPKKQIINDNYKKNLSNLYSNNIIFTNPEKLSAFLNEKSPRELLEWWSSKQIQKIVKNLQENYARYRPNYKNILKEILLSNN